MLSLEDQIRELADYAFETTEPVQFDPNDSEEPSNLDLSRSLLTLVAAIAVLVGGIAISRFVQNSETETINPADALLEIDDPLDINLDSLIEFSAERRISSIGEYTTFDFDQLPDGWSAEQNFALTSPGQPATFWQQLFVSGPGPIRLVVNVTGALDGSVAVPNSESVVAEGPAIVGDREIVDQGSGRITWIENGTSTVEILNSGLGLMNAAEAMELAGYLVPVVTELDWQLEARRQGAPPIERMVQFAGLVDGTAWHVALESDRLILITGPDFARPGGLLPITEGFIQPGPTEVVSAVESVSVPGGVVLYGHAPDNVASVRLNLLYGSAIVPVVPYETDRVAFAVPISDRLDPTTLEFLDVAGNVVERTSLSNLPPYGS